MLIPVDKALKHRVVMLSGDEENPRRRSLSALIDAACPEGDDFDFEAVEAEASPPGEWIAAAGTTPFLAARRTVIVRHLLRVGPPSEATEKDAKEPPPSQPIALRVLVTGLVSLPPTALLVLVADDETGDLDRQRKLKTARAAWEKAVTAAQGYLYAVKTDAKSIHAAVRQECERLGAKMTPKATDLLVEMTGGSLSRALDELEKLAVYCGTEPIRDADVKNVVVPAREWDVFKLVDAVVACNAALTLQQLRVLVGSATHADAAANQGIFPNLSRQFRLLWQARLCIEAKTSPAKAPPSVSACFPEKPNLASVPEWQQDRAMRSARQITLPKLARCMQLLADANAELIGLLPAYSAMESLEQMVLKMIEAIRGA